MPEQIYLDYNATAPTRPSVIEAVAEAMQLVGNPSSVHTSGRAARRVMEDARKQIAKLSGTVPANIVFTGGATESNNLALSGFGQTIEIITTTAEHPSILEPVEARRVSVDDQGVIDLVELDQVLATDSGGVKLLSIILINNETGVIQPLEEILPIARKHGVKVHVDAVQAAGKMDLSFDDWDIDLMSLSAHKIGGPKGIGALVVHPRNHLTAAIRGGGQEKGRRAGTENVPGAAGFGEAARLALSEMPDQATIWALRDQMEQHIKTRLPGCLVMGEMALRAGHVSCIAAPGLKAETQVMAMDLAGFAVSAGSACSSGKVRQSHVLAAMGFPPEIAGSAIRISLGQGTTAEEIDKFVDAYCSYVEKQSAKV